VPKADIGYSINSSARSCAGYETIIMDVKLDKGTVVARHTHPGIESTYIMEGSIEVPVEGRETNQGV